MIKSIINIIVLLCIFVCLPAYADWQFTAADVNALHSKPANARIYYGKHSQQFGDLRVPESPGPHPVAIIIHGGCWIASFADLKNTSALADALRDLGIATWNIEYRRHGNEGASWPSTFTDIAQATDYLRTIQEPYHLDLNRVIVIGQSAGGQLALWVAARHRLPKSSELYLANPLPIQGVLVLGGVPDLKVYRPIAHKTCGVDSIGKLLGENEMQIQSHYKETSPIELLPLNTPQILVYGLNDQVVPVKLGQDYQAKANKKGEQVEIKTVPDAAHHEYNVPNSITWPTVKAAVQSLLKMNQKS